MKAILITILVSFAVSFFMVQGFLARSPESADASLSPAPPPMDFRGVVDELMEENQALAARVAFLENQPTGAVRLPATGDWVSRQEFVALQEELRETTQELSNGSNTRIDFANPQVRAQLGAALEEIRKAGVLEKIDAQEVKQAAGLEHRLAKMQTQLGLTPTQVQQMRGALETKNALDAELTRRWEVGEDKEVLGQVKAENWATHQAELARILTPAQLELHRGALAGKVR